MLPLLKLSKSITDVSNTAQVDLRDTTYPESYDIAAFRTYALGNSGSPLSWSCTEIAQTLACEYRRLRSQCVIGLYDSEVSPGMRPIRGREDNAALMIDFFNAAATHVRSAAQGRPSAIAAQERRSS